ncbi:MAG: hypothetical protein ACJAYX_004899 [Planctomycetota bacterium]|jgi:hypothetical protein
MLDGLVEAHTSAATAEERGALNMLHRVLPGAGVSSGRT